MLFVVSYCKRQRHGGISFAKDSVPSILIALCFQLSKVNIWPLCNHPLNSARRRILPFLNFTLDMKSFYVIKPKFRSNSLTTVSMDMSKINQKTTLVSADAILR